MKLVCYKMLLGLVALTLLSHRAMSQGFHVQTKTLFQSGTSVNIIQTFTAQGSTTGNLIVVHLTYSGQTISVSSVTDSRSNTYVRSNGPTNWNGGGCWRSEVWYSYNITGGTFPITIAATLSGSPANVCGLQYFQMYMSEFTGIVSISNPLDKVSSAVGSSTTPNSGAQVVGSANELIYGAAVGGSAGTISPGGTFTTALAANGNLVELKNGGAAGSYFANFTALSTGTWVADMATFRTTGIALPIKLNSFEASVEKAGTVNVGWSTEVEVNNDYFELQRSGDGSNWSVVKKLNGAGSSSVTKYYQVTDTHPFNGINYYRLNQVDFDGKSSFSKVIKVEATSPELSNIKGYPNPVENWINLEGDADELNSIIIFNVFGENMNGRITETVMKESGLSLNLSPLGSGVYLIKTSTGHLKILKR